MQPPMLPGEVARLRRHFNDVVAELRGRDRRDWTEAQRGRRASSIAALEDYAERGVFPINTRFHDRWAPSFVDDFGTRCAMAELVARTGGERAVDRIRRTQNHALVRELAEDADLVAWLDENGLTLDEAARIQPQYPPRPIEECFCPFHGDQAITLLEATAKAHNGGTVTPLDAVVDAVHGDASVYSVGQVVQVESSAAAGTRLLLYTASNPGDLLVLPLVIEGGNARCAGPFSHGDPFEGSTFEAIGACVALPTDSVIAASLSATCTAEIGKDPRVQIEECPNTSTSSGAPATTGAGSTSTGGDIDIGGGACSTSSGVGPAPFAIGMPAVALVVAILRMRRRSASTTVGQAPESRRSRS